MTSRTKELLCGIALQIDFGNLFLRSRFGDDFEGDDLGLTRELLGITVLCDSTLEGPLPTELPVLELRCDSMLDGPLLSTCIELLFGMDDNKEGLFSDFMSGANVRLSGCSLELTELVVALLGVSVDSFFSLSSCMLQVL